MCSKACATRQDFSIESTASAEVSGDVLAIETIFNFYVRITFDYSIQNPIKSEKTFNQLS